MHFLQNAPQGPMPQQEFFGIYCLFLYPHFLKNVPMLKDTAA